MDKPKSEGVRPVKTCIKTLRAILFDFDGTLVELPVNYSRMRKKLRVLFNKYNVSSEFKPLIPSVERCLSVLKRKGIPNGGIEKVRKAAYDIMDGEELFAIKSSRLMLGSKEVLNFAKKRGIKIVVFTRNCSRCVNAVFKKYNFPKPDLIASRDKVKMLKPDKEHINYVLKKLRLSNEDCIIIGDSFHDVEAGKKHNIKTIIIKTT